MEAAVWTSHLVHSASERLVTAAARYSYLNGFLHMGQRGVVQARQMKWPLSQILPCDNQVIFPQ